MNTDTGALLRYLKEKEAAEGSLSGLLAFYREILAVQRLAEAKLAPLPVPNASESASRLSRGIPMLDPDIVLNHWGAVEETFHAMKSVFMKSAVLGNEGAAPADLGLDREAACKWLRLAPSGTSDGKHELLATLIQETFRPFLSAYSRLVHPYWRQEDWRRGYCPACGGGPDLAFIDGEQGSRWLMCSQCDTTWLFQRLQCPGCGTQDPASLSYLTDATGRYRLYLCEKCRCYVKAVDRRHNYAEVPLPLERFYTAGLDDRAGRMGYALPRGFVPALPGLD